MTLDQLRIFLTVVEYLHFTKAAEALQLTQPSISAAINNLETEYDIKLFHRIGRHIELTDAGRLLQIEAKKILDQVAFIKRGLAGLNDLHQGELQLGTSLLIGNYWLPVKICQFKRQYPGVLIHTHLGDAEEIRQGVISGRFDLGFVSELLPSTAADRLQQKVLAFDRLSLVVGQAHPWLTRSTVRLADLRLTGWVSQESTSNLQQRTDHLLQTWGIPPSDLEILMIVNSSEMVKAIVEEGIGVALLPDGFTERERQQNRLRSISIFRQNGSKQLLDTKQPIIKINHRN
jgi:DNA-binding transcriptional LysR family regulator